MGKKSLLILVVLLFSYSTMMAAVLSGSGTSSQPYLIKNEADLTNFIINYTSPSEAGKYFRLESNITLSSLDKLAGWIPKKGEIHFYGHLDGNKKIIKGVWKSQEDSCAVGGLFGVLEMGASIKDLGLEIAAQGIHASLAVGGLVGINNGSISYCFTKGGKVFSSERVVGLGGLVGHNSTAGKIQYSYSHCEVEGKQFIIHNSTMPPCIGGLVGVNSGEIGQTYANGKLTSKYGGGGLVGLNLNTGKFTSISYYIVTSNPKLQGVGTNFSQESPKVFGKEEEEFLRVQNLDGWDCNLPNMGWKVSGYCIYPALFWESGEKEPSVTGKDTCGVFVKNCVYSTINKADQYIWSLSGGEITSGQGTARIEVTWNTLGRQKVDLKLKRVNGCEINVPSFGVEVLPCEKVVHIAGPISCGGSQIVYEYSVESGIQSYLWSVSGGTILTGQGGSKIQVLWEQKGTNKVSVYATERSGCIVKGDTLQVQVSSSPFAGGDGSHQNPFQISSAVQLSNLRYFLGQKGLGKYFQVVGNIDLSAYSQNTYGSEGWLPVGTQEEPFRGTLTGGGKIEGLWINRPYQNEVGLFGALGVEASIRCLEIFVDGARGIKGASLVGALVGFNQGKIESCFIRGYNSIASVMGDEMVGGLVGNNEGLIMFSSSVQSVLGNINVGGLVGYNNWANYFDIQGVDFANIYSCSSRGQILGRMAVGGLVGMSIGFIQSTYFNGRVQASVYAGGLVGVAGSILIKSSYTVADVSTVNGVPGALVGVFQSYSFPPIDGCYYESKGYEAVGSVYGSPAPGDYGAIGVSPQSLFKFYGDGWWYNPYLTDPWSRWMICSLDEYTLKNGAAWKDVSSYGSYPILAWEGLNHLVYSPSMPQKDSITSESTAEFGSTGQEQEILIVPNPTSGELTVRMEKDHPEIKVYDVQARFLFRTHSKKIDLSPYPSGVYILDVEGIRKRVIKR